MFINFVCSLFLCPWKGKEVAGTVTLKQVYEIAKVKAQDKSFRNVSLESVCHSVVGSARSIGIEVIQGRDDENSWNNKEEVAFVEDI